MKCPICDREIDHLNIIVTGAMEYHLSLDVQEDIQYGRHDFVADADINDFKCPKCNAILFDEETKAINFLRGKQDEG